VNALRKDQVVEFRDKPHFICRRDQHFTGRRGSIIKVEMKDVMTGRRFTERFNANDALELMHLSSTPYTFLYAQGNKLHLLHPDTYEELVMDADALEGGEKSLPFLQDNMTVNVQCISSTPSPIPISIRLPQFQSYMILRDEPKAAQSAKGVSCKTAYVGNGVGLRILVPQFVEVGEHVVVDVHERKYVRRGGLEETE